jgi:hypothetical protein
MPPPCGVAGALEVIRPGPIRPVVTAFVVAGQAAELVASKLGGLFVACAACSLVAVRATGPSSSSGRGVLGQYMFPLA